MNHLHFASIPSTQLYLKDNIDKFLLQDAEILISCDEQTNGIGRTGNAWLFNQNSIATSFTLSPNSQLTLTPIEIGVLICKFFEQHFQQKVMLKWPNDLLNTEGQKIGGLIVQYHSPKVLMVGVGINLGKLSISLKHARYEVGSIQLETQKTSKEWALEIYQFISTNRMRMEDVINDFNKRCAHYYRPVSMLDSGELFDGVFLGINQHGAALVKNSQGQKEFISGSLTII